MIKDQKERRKMRKTIAKGLTDVLELHSQAIHDLREISRQVSMQAGSQIASLFRYEFWSENAVGEPAACTIPTSIQNISNHQQRTVLKAAAPIEEAMTEVHANLLTLLPGEAIRLRYDSITTRVSLVLSGTNVLEAVPSSWIKNLPMIEAVSAQGADLHTFLIDRFGHVGKRQGLHPRLVIRASDMPEAILRSAVGASSLKDRTKANFRVPTIFGAAELIAPEVHLDRARTALSDAQRADITAAWDALTRHIHTEPGFDYTLTAELVIARGKVISKKIEPETSPLVAQSDLDAWMSDLEGRMAAADPFAEMLGTYVKSGEIKLSTWMTPRACRPTVSQDGVIFKDLTSLIDQLALRGDANMKHYVQLTDEGLTSSQGFSPQGAGDVYELACATMEELATAQAEAKARIDTFFA